MKYTKAAAIVAGSMMAVGVASPAMADDAPRAAAPVQADQLLDTKTVNDTSASLDEVKDVVDIDVFAELTRVAKEARLAAESATQDVRGIANEADVDAAGKLNDKAKTRGAMPHLGGLPIG